MGSLISTHSHSPQERSTNLSSNTSKHSPLLKPFFTPLTNLDQLPQLPYFFIGSTGLTEGLFEDGAGFGECAKGDYVGEVDVLETFGVLADAGYETGEIWGLALEGGG